MNDEVIVTTYSHPDLDGTACMYAYSELLSKKGIKSNYYIREEPRKEVKILCEMFNIILKGRKEVYNNEDTNMTGTAGLKNKKGSRYAGYLCAEQTGAALLFRRRQQGLQV